MQNYLKEQASKLAVRAAIMQRTKTISEAIRTATLIKIAEAENLNNVFIPQNIFEENEKLINQIYLTTIARGNQNLLHSQKDIVSNLAGQCPMIAGSAVFKARYIYSFFGTLVFNDKIICPLKSEESTEGKVVKNLPIKDEVKIFPNPANEEVNIQSNSTAKLTLLVKDVNGKLLHSEDFTEFTIVSSKNMANGLYFYEIWNGNHKVTVQKLAIIH